MEVEEKPSEKKSPLVIALLLYLGVSSITSVFTLFMQIPFILVTPLFVSTFILGFFYTQVFSIYITFYIYKRITKENYRELFSKYFLRDKIVLRVIYSSVISAVVYLLYYSIFQNFFNIELSTYRIGYIIMTAILLIPYIVFNELFFRGLLGNVAKSRSSNIIFLILIRLFVFFMLYINLMNFIGTTGDMLGFLSIILYMTAVLQVSLDLISSYIFHRSHSITEEIIWNTIIYSLLLTAISPII